MNLRELPLFIVLLMLASCNEPDVKERVYRKDAQAENRFQLSGQIILEAGEEYELDFFFQKEEIDLKRERENFSVVTEDYSLDTMGLDFTQKRVVNNSQWLDVSNRVSKSKPSKLQVDTLIVRRELASARRSNNGTLNNLNYYQLQRENGAVLANLHSFHEDSRGLYWIGERNGVTKFDGESFVFYPLANKSELCEVRNIYEDSAGVLWFSASNLKRTIKYDGKNWVENHYLNDSVIGKSTLLHIGRNNEKIFCSIRDVNIVTDSKVYSIKEVLSRNLNHFYFPGFSILEPSPGMFFIYGTDGVYKFFDGKLTFLPLSDEEIEWSPLYIDTNKSVWLISKKGFVELKHSGGYVLYENTLTSTFVRSLVKHFRSPINAEYAPMAYLNIRRFGVDDASGYVGLLDSKGQVWQTQSNKELRVYKTSNFTHKEFGEPQSGSSMVSALEKVEDDLWLGFHEGPLCIVKNGELTKIELNDAVIRDFLPVKDKGVIFNLEGGDIGIFSGVSKGNVKIEKLNCNLFFFKAIQDNEGFIWLFGYSDFVKLDLQRNKAFKYSVKNGKMKGENRLLFRDVVLSDLGELLIVTQGNGLIKLQEDKIVTYTKESGLPSNYLTSIIHLQNREYCVGSKDAGVFFLDEDLSVTRSFSTNEGLSSDVVWSLIQDSSGVIWLGQDLKLDALVVEGDSLRILNFENPTKPGDGEFFAGAVLQMDDNLFWGTNRGLVHRKVMDLQFDIKPQLMLSGLSINTVDLDFSALLDSLAYGNSYTYDEKYDFTELEFDSIVPFMEIPNRISVPYNQNQLILRFGYSKVSGEGDMKLTYFIEGLSKEWSKPSSDLEVALLDISPGRYKLRARLSVGNSIASEEFTYLIEVRPPWYKTWWAYTLFTMLSISLVTYLFVLINKKHNANQKAKRLQEINDMRSDIYENITHEFKTPLALIIGHTDRINNYERETAAIKKNSLKLLDRVNELLGVAKIESGDIEVHLFQVDVIQILRHAVDSFQGYALEKHINLQVICEVENLMMDLDESRFTQVLDNLLSNAIKYSNEGDNVKVEVQIAKNDWLEVTVLDTGVGMDEVKITHVFDKYYRADQGKAEGTGIGLYFSQKVIHAMGGSISVQSKKGKGSSFKVRLPIQQESEVLMNELTHLEKTEVVKDVRTEERKEVLVVEDNIDLQNFLKETLSYRYNVVVASDGDEGLKTAQERIPDLIISDMIMPRMNGNQLVEKLKIDTLTNHIPVIMLTAMTAQELKIKALTKGVEVYLTKPFDSNELLLQAQNLVELKENILKIDRLNKEVDELKDPFVEQLEAILEVHYENSEFGVPELIDQSNYSQMQLYRKLKSALQITPSQFIKEYRLKIGEELLRTSLKSVSEIAYEVGFSSLNYFSRSFAEKFECSPREYREKQVVK